MTSDTDITPEQREALNYARTLAAAGVPLFLAHPDPTAKTGYRPPRGWQHSRPDPAVADRWQPGVALCAVMGQGLDLIDIDPRNGGDVNSITVERPHAYAIASTPSGGLHAFVGSMGCGSKDNIYPGIDVKSGLASGEGRGFAFIAPTVRASVTTGEPATYIWQQPPTGDWVGATDTTGAALAAHIQASRVGSSMAHAPAQSSGWFAEFMGAREPQGMTAAARAIDAKLEEVARFAPGQGSGFRHTLLRAALTLGGYVGAEYLDERDAVERLRDAVALAWGNDPDDEDELWIQQGLDDGAVRPFLVLTPEQEMTESPQALQRAAEGDAPPSPPEPPWSIYSVLPPPGEFDPRKDMTDQGQAKAVAHAMFSALRYAGDTGQWVKRERDAWSATSADMSGWIIAKLAELMPPGAKVIPAKTAEFTTPQEWQAWRRKTFMSSAGASKIGRKLRDVIMSDHPASIRISELDVNPEILWAGGVPWDLGRSEDVPTPADWVDPNTPHLHTASVRPDPTVPTPYWDAFVASVLPDPEVRTWAMRVLSIGLTGYPDAALPIMYGTERSGKSSLAALIMKVIGTYGHAADPKLLGDVKEHSTIIYDLKGRRFSMIDEGPKRGHDGTERLKQLTGGAPLTARPMNANPLTFDPTHTLVMTTNNEPTLTDPALRARARLIPCNEPEERVQPAREALLRGVFEAEAPGILAALMRDAAIFLRDRRSVSQAAAPISIRALGEELAEAQDPVAEWVENCTVPAEPGTPARSLYNAFAEWHRGSPVFARLTIPAETAFGRRLTKLGYPRSPARINDKWYRPLSVLSGSRGVAPWEPIPDPHMTRSHLTNLTSPPRPNPTPTAPPSGSTPQTSGSTSGSRQVHDEPDVTHNPSTGAVFAGPTSGTSGSSIEAGEINTHPPVETPERYGEKPGNLTNLTSGDAHSAPDLQGEAPSGSAVGFADPVGLQPNLTEPVGGAATAPVSPRRVSATEAARLADELGITKAEARKRITDAAKAAKRRDAIAAAGGELYELPVVVDREGNTIPVTLEQSVAIVRACLGRACDCIDAGPGHLSVDVETSGYPLGHELYELRTVQLGDDVATVVFDPVEQSDTIRMLLTEPRILHAFSATADLIPIAHADLMDIEHGWDRMVDVVIAAKLADPSQAPATADGLKPLAPAVLGAHAVVPATDEARATLFHALGAIKQVKVDTPVEKNGWYQVDRRTEVMCRYAASDVLDTHAIARTLDWPDPRILHRERLAQRMTATVTDVGIRIDREHVAALTGPALQGQAQAAAKVREFGVDNPGSSPQVAAAAQRLGATLPTSKKTGAPSAALAAIEALRGAEGDLGAFVDALLDYRHHSTLLGTFLRPYSELCERGDGRARPTIYTLGTDTGRMSAVRPNIQQLPRAGGVRACMTADPGHLFISADFSGVEIRVAAALSQDPTLLAFLREGRALHEEMAAQVYGPEWTEEDKYRVKRGVFGRLYGGGVPTLAAQMGVHQGIAQSLVDTLDAMLPVLAQWSEFMRQQVKRGNTQFPSYAGRTIHFPKTFPHKAPNYAIQGTARELLIDALVRWRETRWGHCSLFPVHDELVVMVPEQEAADAITELLACMAGNLHGVDIVASPAKGGPSFAWADSV